MNLPHRTYFFKVDGGVRFKVSDKRAEGSHHQMVCISDTNAFSGFKTEGFQGDHMRLMIKGFSKKRTEEEIKKELAPEVLKTGKEKIKSEMEESNKDVKEPEKINMYEQLVEGVINT